MNRTANARQEAKVVSYFLETDSSYRNWADSEAYFLHYGFHDRPGMPQREALEKMNAAMAEQVKIPDGARILDAGCGVGATSIWLAKNCGAHVDGITLSDLQVKKARTFARSSGVQGRVRFHRKNYLNTGFPANTFDVVWIQESSSQTYEKEKLLKETLRILKPKGRMILTDLFLLRDKLKETEQYCIDKWCDGWAMAYLPVAKKFGAQIRRAGFSQLRIFDNTEKIAESALRIYQRGKEGYPDDLLTKARTVLRIKHTEANMFQKIALDMGLWRHLSFVATK
ncbi:MAG: methyltransferase domain-containing protein [Turneriella sp.]